MSMQPEEIVILIKRLANISTAISALIRIDIVQDDTRDFARIPTILQFINEASEILNIIYQVHYMEK
jgi:hypothetical protein